MQRVKSRVYFILLRNNYSRKMFVSTGESLLIPFYTFVCHFRGSTLVDTRDANLYVFHAIDYYAADHFL